ncbi:MAG: LLM class flavin-dependent oxidoreductase [Candidatus Rokubacteria bacterium]|nr:LLM class flavin-dependent oxidoreductase [Candidatus Rokubacteria bacterium]
MAIRPTTIEIDLDAAAENVRAVRRLVGSERSIFAAVKADGYGFGAAEVGAVFAASGADWLAVADLAEAAGFDSVWIGDSLTARPRHEPLTLLAAVAGRTRRLRLGTGLLLPALRNPVVLAHVVGNVSFRRQALLSGSRASGKR